MFYSSPQDTLQEIWVQEVKPELEISQESLGCESGRWRSLAPHRCRGFLWGEGKRKDTFWDSDVSW